MTLICLRSVTCCRITVCPHIYFASFCRGILTPAHQYMLPRRQPLFELGGVEGRASGRVSTHYLRHRFVLMHRGGDIAYLATVPIAAGLCGEIRFAYTCVGARRRIAVILGPNKAYTLRARHNNSRASRALEPALCEISCVST